MLNRLSTKGLMSYPQMTRALHKCRSFAISRRYGSNDFGISARYKFGITSTARAFAHVEATC